VAGEIEIRSFRSVFALERRIYRIDTLRLNPAGVPLRGIAWALAFVLAALFAGALPPARWLDPLMPWYLRDIALPLGGAWLCASVRIDGRPLHAAARSCAAHLAGARTLHRLAPAHRRAARWAPPPMLCIPDGSDARFRALRYRGPGVVVIAGPHTRTERRGLLPWAADVTVRELPGRREGRTVLELAPRARVVVRGG
jgi:hypothetical protein